MLLTLVIIVAIFYLKVYTQQSTKILFLYYILCYILYNMKHNKSSFILFATILTIMYMYSDIKKSGCNLYSNDIRLHLENDSIVESNQKNRLVFWGTKYVVIGKGSTKSALLYPTSQIKQIEWVAR
jgi:hypothetical protein